jgi:hypothetical protein
MPKVHEWVGFVVVAVFTVGWVWGLVALIAKRDPGQRFWTWLVVAQVIAGVQAALGLILLVLGYRPDTWLHYVYGFGPLVVFLIAHQMARDLGGQSGSRFTQPWVVFAAAAFICFGLAGRALMTGLGIG